MDKSVFSKPAVIETLNKDFYAIRFNAETDEEIIFGGQLFVNDQVGESRTPMHQIAQLLATRDGKFAPPVLLLLDPEFNALGRNFGYLDSNQLLEFISTK